MAPDCVLQAVKNKTGCNSFSFKFFCYKYKPCDMTEASQYIYTPINPTNWPANNHCPENGLNHVWVMECSNVYKIPPSSVLHLTLTHNSTGYATECWLIAIKLHVVSTQEKSSMSEHQQGKEQTKNTHRDFSFVNCTQFSSLFLAFVTFSDKKWPKKSFLEL